MKPSIHIISTASLSDELISRLTGHNISIEAYPFIRTTAIVTEESRSRIGQLQQLLPLVVFTSANAVEAVGTQLTAKPAWQVYCIEGATQQAVLKYFEKENIVDTAPDAASLGDRIVADNPANVVFFCGNQRLGLIPVKMANHQIAVEEIIVYHTELTPVIVKQGVQGVLFFSSSAVNSFLSVNELDPATICFAIGATTAATLNERVNNRVVIAGHPGKKEVIDLVIQYYHARC